MQKLEIVKGKKWQVSNKNLQVIYAPAQVDSTQIEIGVETALAVFSACAWDRVRFFHMRAYTYPYINYNIDNAVVQYIYAKNANFPKNKGMDFEYK